MPAEGEFDEAAHLGVRDVTVNSWEDPQWLKIRLRASKTDPFRKGIMSAIPAATRRENPASCTLGVLT